MYLLTTNYSLPTTNLKDMPDRFSKEVRSRIMSRIRSRNTGLEQVIFRLLRLRGIPFRRHYRGALGTPDVARPARRLALFIDGDFWHGYRYPSWRRTLPTKFWRDKIERNRRRDRRNFATLRRHGWSVLRVWEHELKKRPVETAAKIVAFLRQTR